MLKLEIHNSIVKGIDVSFADLVIFLQPMFGEVRAKLRKLLDPAGGTSWVTSEIMLAPGMISLCAGGRGCRGAACLTLGS